jgi:hypothetical protein
MSNVAAGRRHICVCTDQPRCIEHRAIEWGGGEPDTCAPHLHMPQNEIARAVRYLRQNSPAVVAAIEEEALRARGEPR